MEKKIAPQADASRVSFIEDEKTFKSRNEWHSRLQESWNGRIYSDILMETRDSLAEKALATAAPPETGFKGMPTGPELSHPDGMKVKVSKSQNPLPLSSACFASTAWKVTGTGAFDHVFLRFPAGGEAVANLFLPSAKVFRYEDAKTGWLPLMRSGYDAATESLWAAIPGPGIYVAVALPARADEMAPLYAMYLSRTQIQKSRKVSDRRLLIKGILERYGAQPARKIKGKNTRPALSQLPMVKGMASAVNLPEWTLMDLFTQSWHGSAMLSPVHLPYDRNVLQSVAGALPCATRDWASHGPLNVNGRVKCIAVHPTNSNIVYAGSANGGLWKTTDAGLTWRSIWSNSHPMSFGSIAICRDFPERMWAGTGENSPGYGPTFNGNGVYYSIDAGETWTIINPGQLGPHISKLVVHPHIPRKVYVACDTGLFVRDDYTNLFVMKIAGNFSDLLMDPNNPNILYAAKHFDGIYKSTDAGETWLASNGGWVFTGPRPGQEPPGPVTSVWLGIPTGVAADWIKLAIGKSGPPGSYGSNFLLAKLGNRGQQVFASTDGGAHWLPYHTTPGVEYNEWTSMVAIHPSQPDIVFAGERYLFRKTASTSFTQTTGTHDDHHAIDFDPNHPNVMWAATDGGVYRSTDFGATWTSRSYLLVGAEMYAIGLSQEDRFMLVASMQDEGVLRSTGSFDWATVVGDEGGLAYIDPNSINNVYVCPWHYNLMRSTDGGNTFTGIHRNLKTFVDGKWWYPEKVESVSVRPGVPDQVIAAATWFYNDMNAEKRDLNRLFLSLDRGNSWTDCCTTEGRAKKVVFSQWNGNYCYAATEYVADPLQRSRIYRSSNGGQTWAKVLTTLLPNAGITALAVQWDFRICFAIGGGNPTLWISTDYGVTATNITGNNAATRLPRAYISSIVFHPYEPGTIYVGTDVGVYRSLNAGLDWAAFNDGIGDGDLPVVPVTDIGLRITDMRLFAATIGRGCFYRQL